MATIGQQLKRAREGRGESIEDVAFHTRIPAARLRDMERDDLSRFANLTYARGFLKLYGAYLELDLSDYLGQFHTDDFAQASGHEYARTAQATQNLPASVVVDHGQARRPGLYVLVLTALIAGAVVWWNSTGGESGTDAGTANAPGPEPQPAPQRSPQETAPLASRPPAPPQPLAVEVSAVFPSRDAARGDSPVPTESPTDKVAVPPRAKVVEEEEPESER